MYYPLLLSTNPTAKPTPCLGTFCEDSPKTQKKSRFLFLAKSSTCYKTKQRQFQKRKSNKIMTQSVTVFSLLLLLVTLTFIMDQSYALLSLTLPVRQRTNNGSLFRGNLQGQGNNFQRPEIYEAIETNSISKTTSLQENFDSETYRQKMVDLVYQSSMERFS